MIVLDKVFRQKDSGFLRLLNELRRGIVSPETNITLQRKVQENKNKEREVKSSGFMKSSVMGAVAAAGGGGGGGEGKEEMVVRPTKLYAINRSETALLCPTLPHNTLTHPTLLCSALLCPTLHCLSLLYPAKSLTHISSYSSSSSSNRDVDSYNASELSRLSGESTFTFTARDDGIEQYLRQLTAGIKAPKDLELRVGAQVSALPFLSIPFFLSFFLSFYFSPSYRSLLLLRIHSSPPFCCSLSYAYVLTIRITSPPLLSSPYRSCY